jgi:endonuclease/exonuclease/phosphatase family metal-dependent hydrolase
MPAAGAIRHSRLCYDSRDRKLSMAKKKSTRRPTTAAANDNLSKAFSGKKLVPENYRGTDKFLDVVQWNLEWFGATKSRDKDKKRSRLILDILAVLNADILVFQEVAGPTRNQDGSLDSIAAALTSANAGDYRVEYTRAGGEQRVAMMWDRDFVRAKIEPSDLFERGTHTTPDGKDAFATRTPLHAYFSVRENATETGGGTKTYDFQILGVHLKAMTEGYKQRLHSAKVLADWLTKEAPKTDSDAVILGDWNAPPDDKSWAPFHKLEKAPNSKIKFSDINDPSDYSYLWLANRSTKFVSRIDLTALTLSSFQNVAGKAAEVVLWQPIEETIARAGEMKASEVAKVMKEIKEAVSDHLPVVTRFYFTDKTED